jgi:hypothetical protein
MTRSFRQYVSCPKCGHNHTAESAFQRWQRENPKLDSREGHVVSDFDFTIHRYRTPMLGRSLQCVMFLEVKTRMAKVDGSQAKTLNIMRQIVQNQGKLGKPMQLSDGHGGPIRQVRCFGGFELRLSSTSPEDSEWMEWNRKRITVEQLEKLLRFDIDPITFKKMDWRDNHHTGKGEATPSLFLPASSHF